MREILFRAKAINRDKGYHRTEYKNGDWVYGLITRLYDERFENLPAEMTDTSGASGIEVDYKTIGQYTGLTDKNGKKIFEGDILSTENGTFSNTGMGHILLYRGMWTSFYGQDALGRDCFDELYTVCSAREIIGNIHNNPELIGGEPE